MNMRTVIAVAFLCCAFRSAVASQMGGSLLSMTTTGGANSITVDVTINDTGQVAGCAYLLLTRFGALVAIFPRQPGLHTFSYTDTNVVPGHIYWYELVPSSILIPYPSPSCDPYAFRYAFGSGWGLPFDIPGHIGTDPIPLAHGKLVPDQNWPYAHLEPCDSPYWWYFEYGIPAGFEQYLGQEVLMYGDYSYWSVQNGWIPTITSFEPLPCAPVATNNATWGAVKSMYR